MVYVIVEDPITGGLVWVLRLQSSSGEGIGMWSFVFAI